MPGILDKFYIYLKSNPPEISEIIFGRGVGGSHGPSAGTYIPGYEKLSNSICKHLLRILQMYMYYVILFITIFILGVDFLNRVCYNYSVIAERSSQKRSEVITYKATVVSFYRKRLNYIL